MHLEDVMARSDLRHDRSTWEGRVPRAKIARLYASDAAGLIDEDLIEEVGISLLVRIESIFKARQANSGRASCPICDIEVAHDGQKETVLRCDSCNWELSWAEYHKSIRGKHLAAAGLGDFLSDFANDYPRARSAREKMVIVDTLIHRYHWELEGGLTRPGATDLIGGKPAEVLEFLNNLTYGENSTPEVLKARDEWLAKVKQSRQQRKAKRTATLSGKTERDKRKLLKQRVRKEQLEQRDQT
jgi:hypothetical protein